MRRSQLKWFAWCLLVCVVCIRILLQVLVIMDISYQYDGIRSI